MGVLILPHPRADYPDMGWTGELTPAPTDDFTAAKWAGIESLLRARPPDMRPTLRVSQHAWEDQAGWEWSGVVDPTLAAWFPAMHAETQQEFRLRSHPGLSVPLGQWEAQQGWMEESSATGIETDWPAVESLTRQEYRVPARARLTVWHVKPEPHEGWLYAGQVGPDIASWAPVFHSQSLLEYRLRVQPKLPLQPGGWEGVAGWNLQLTPFDQALMAAMRTLSEQEYRLRGRPLLVRQVHNREELWQNIEASTAFVFNVLPGVFDVQRLEGYPRWRLGRPVSWDADVQPAWFVLFSGSGIFVTDDGLTTISITDAERVGVQRLDTGSTGIR